jgi:predicted CoA-binding protein
MTQGRRLVDPHDIATLVRSLRRVAVLGMRSEAFAERPAHYVPAALAAMGIEILPVALHEPTVSTMLGAPVVRSLAELTGAIDCVDVFRRSDDVPAHLADLLALRPRAVWLQSGIRNDAVAAALVAAGIDVVQDRCLMVDARRYRVA